MRQTKSSRVPNVRQCQESLKHFEHLGTYWFEFLASTVSSMSAASIAASRDPFTGVANSSHQVTPTSPPGYNNSQSSTSQLARVEEKVSGRGITRSSASYGIQQLLQDQVSYHV